MRASGVVVVTALLLAGCSSEVNLTVDLRTDFVPASEITGVTTRLDAIEVDHVPSVGEPWLAGARVAEFRDVAPGDHRVTVSLFAGTRLIARRDVALSIAESYALTVVITHSCADVTCPGTGDPASATTCVNGTCASPACGNPGEPTCPTCTSDATCPPARAACATARCLAGACLDEPHDERCPAGQLCSLAVGCVATTTPMDAGPPRDAGPRRDAGAGFDAGPPRDSGPAPCEPDCSGRECGPDPVCGESCGDPCMDGATCDDAGRCDCPMTQTYCSGECFDLTTDNDHCGACDTSCAGGTCVSGACICPAGLSACRVGCVDFQSSSSNCGGCSRYCSVLSGPICCAGTCTFTMIDPINCGVCGTVCGGTTPDCCGGACLDVESDNSNCGRCGFPCPVGMTCMAGTCR